jgi:hypothetical protein
MVNVKMIFMLLSTSYDLFEKHTINLDTMFMKYGCELAIQLF